MRFGVCASVEHAAALVRCGYEYIELAAAADLMPEADDAAWHTRRREIESMPIRAEVFNSFVRSAKIIGPEAEPARLRAYVLKTLTRAALVGGSVVVFGSGGARNVPVGWPSTSAHRQMMEFLGYCADASDATGVIVAIEPLCRAECNFINLVSEGATLAREVGRSGVRNLADTFHMAAEEEPLTAVVESADVLAHVHTADTGRLAPGTGQYDHVELFRALSVANYDDRLSIECSWQNQFDEQIGPAYLHLKQAYLSAAMN